MTAHLPSQPRRQWPHSSYYPPSQLPLGTVETRMLRPGDKFPELCVRLHWDERDQRGLLHVPFRGSSCLCEHQLIQKLFGAEGGRLGAITVLELFNLILANTSQVDSLVYIYSQPSLHQYLFEGFRIDEQPAETVEYYVQLLKTLIMKMNHGHPSLIKLFCNNRYACFPLLCQVTFLAIHAQEELVLVTAQQCVLMLVSLLASKKVGEGYLVEAQMAAFYHELTLQLSSTKDMEGSLRYIVDLMCTLQNNLTSLTMLMNCFTLNLILTRLKDLPSLLRILLQWSDILEEHQELSLSVSLEMRLVVFRIASKLVFHQFLNGSYLATLNYSHHKETESRLEMTKSSKFIGYLRTRFDKLESFLGEFDSHHDSEKEDSLIMLSWAEFIKNVQPQQLKTVEERKGIFKLFAARSDPSEQYFKRAVEANGFNYENTKVPLFKLTFTINFKTALFVTERLFLREQLQKGESPFVGFEEYEVYFNDNRGNFELNQQFCEVVLQLLAKVHQKGFNLSKPDMERG